MTLPPYKSRVAALWWRVLEWTLVCAVYALVTLGCSVGSRRLPAVRQRLGGVLKGQRRLVGEFQTGDAREGLFSVQWLCQRTSIDFDSDEAVNQAYRAQMGLKQDLGLLGRCLISLLYGGNTVVESEGELVIDTVLVHNHTVDSALHVIEQRIQVREPAPLLQVSFVNPACVNIARRNAAYRKAVNQSGMSLIDGIGMRIAGQLLGQPVLQNVNGTDLYPRLCKRLAEQAGRVFFLGGQPGIADEVARRAVNDFPGLQVAGSQHGFFDEADTAALIDRINAAKPDVLFVAMGVPHQELWIAQHADRLNVPVVLGVGGLFDFLSERIARAPVWLRQLGLEWAYRLKQEPARMWKRYVVGNPVFLLHILVQRYCGWVRPEPLGHFTQEAVQSGPVKAQRALVVATAGLARPDGFSDLSAAFLPVADKVALAHQFEMLIAQGVRHIDVQGRVEDHLRLKALIASRDWGANIRALPALTAIGLDRLESICQAWLASSDKDSNTGSAAWVVYAHQLLPKSAFEQVKLGQLLTLNETPALGLLAATESPEAAQTHAWQGLGFTLLQAQALIQATLNYRKLGLKPGAEYKEIAPQVWVHCHAKVSSKAKFSGPAFVGPDCVVEAGCQIGAGTVLVGSVVLEGLSQVSASVLLTPMHIRRTLSFDQTVVDHEAVYKFDQEACLPLDLIKGHVVPTEGSEGEQFEKVTKPLTAGKLHIA